VTKRRHGALPTVAVVLAMLALALAAAVVRRALQRASVSQPIVSPSAPTPEGEDFSAAERQGLEEILKHKGAGVQQ
jgi:hypothetical protein